MTNRFDSSPTPAFDEEVARSFLRLLTEGREEYCLELRIKPAATENQKLFSVGFFDNFDRLLAVAKRENGKSLVMVGLNERPIDLFHRFEPNKMLVGSAGATDGDVKAINWLFVDIDSSAPKGMSANAEERLGVNRVVQRVLDALREAGIKPRVLGDSGNGAHILVPMGRASDQALWTKQSPVKKFLEHLKQHELGDAEIDTTAYNPSRMIKLYGTAAVKGRSTIERPHRIAKFQVLGE